MNSKKIAQIIVMIGLGILMGCSNNNSNQNTQEVDHSDSEETHAHEAEAHGNAGENSVELNRKQIKKAGIKLGEFKRMNLSSTVKASGRLELPPQNKADVGAMMGGMVKDINVLPGEFVEEGQVLAYLSDPKFARLQQHYLESIGELEYIEKEYQRKKALYEDDVGSEREFQKIKSEYQSLKAKIQSLASQLRTININPSSLEKGEIDERVVITAPIEGYIKNIHIKMGQYVEPKETLFEIVDNHHIHIDLMVYEQDVPKIKKGQEVLFKLANQDNGRSMKAKIFAVGKALENDQKAVRMHAELNKHYEHLLPGMYVDAHIVTDTVKGKTLPEGGVVTEEDHYYVFYTTSGKDQDHLNFTRVEVKSSTTDAGYAQVDLGNQKIPSNARLVTDNAHYLLREMNEGTGGGHSH